MSQLEDIWNCELESFQTVERLAQCLSLRGQTWQRLKLLREQVIFCPTNVCVVLCVVMCWL